MHIHGVQIVNLRAVSGVNAKNVAQTKQFPGVDQFLCVNVALYPKSQLNAYTTLALANTQVSLSHCPALLGLKEALPFRFVRNFRCISSYARALLTL